MPTLKFIQLLWSELQYKAVLSEYMSMSLIFCLFKPEIPARLVWRIAYEN